MRRALVSSPSLRRALSFYKSLHAHQHQFRKFYYYELVRQVIGDEVAVSKRVGEGGIKKRIIILTNE